MQDITNTARQVVCSPENHLNDTSVFTHAWAAMKAARGQGFDPARLRAAHLIAPPGPSPEPTEQTLERIGAKARDIIAAKNYPVRRRDAA